MFPGSGLYLGAVQSDILHTVSFARQAGSRPLAFLPCGVSRGNGEPVLARGAFGATVFLCQHVLLSRSKFRLLISHHQGCAFVDSNGLAGKLVSFYHLSRDVFLHYLATVKGGVIQGGFCRMWPSFELEILERLFELFCVCINIDHISIIYLTLSIVDVKIVSGYKERKK